MMPRKVPLLVLLALLAGCGKPAAGPGAPLNEKPPAPAATVSVQPNPPPDQPVQDRKADCTFKRNFDQPPEPNGPASTVSARVYLREDPGIVSPVLANVHDADPVTVMVEFDSPVESHTFSLKVEDLRCDYTPEPVPQEVTWLSDRAASIAVRSWPKGKPGPYAVTFSGGKDKEGKEVREVRFQLQATPMTQALQVSSLPVAGGVPKVLFERKGDLEARSVSPDGRYLLAARRPFANTNSHSTIRIPYLIDMQTGRVQTFERAPVEWVRWDLKGGWLWINGWQKVSLQDGTDAGDSLLKKLPPGGGARLYAEVSPDEKWLAYLRRTTVDENSTDAELVMVDLGTGRHTVWPDKLGWALEAPPTVHLQWAPDSSALLLASYRGGSEAPVLMLLDPLTLQRKRLPLELKEYSISGWSPAGKYILVGKYGIVAPDGKPVLQDAGIWSGIWAPDDRFLLEYGSNDDFIVREIVSGKTSSLKRPPRSGLVVGISLDATAIYLAGYVPGR